MMICRICSHPDRAAIDRAIVENRSLRDIAIQFDVHRSSLDRHKKHIPKALAKAKEAETVTESNRLLSQIERLLSQAERIYDGAMESEEWSGAAAAAREIRGCLELLGKLSGELQTAGRVMITSVTIQNLNIADLTQEQVGALYDRVHNEQIREIKQMSNAEIESEIQKLLAADVPKSLSAGTSQVIEGA